jgi:uncharacterized damage-inducible protein DinB
MRKITLFLVLCLPLVAIAQEPAYKDALGFISFNEGKILGLAGTFTQEQYAWRPAEGVRSVGEVLAHIAAANYFIMQSAGIAPPGGVNFQTMEKELMDKAEIITAVQASYAFLKDHVMSFSQDRLGDEVKLPFPGEYTKQTLLFLIVDHISEHLGQLIAYARMNGITPPWSE